MYYLLKVYSAPGTLHDLPERKEGSDLLICHLLRRRQACARVGPRAAWHSCALQSQRMARRSIALSTIVPTGTLILGCNRGSRRTFPHFRLPPKEGERGRGRCQERANYLHLQKALPPKWKIHLGFFIKCSSAPAASKAVYLPGTVVAF